MPSYFFFLFCAMALRVRSGARLQTFVRLQCCQRMLGGDETKKRSRVSDDTVHIPCTRRLERRLYLTFFGGTGTWRLIVGSMRHVAYGASVPFKWIMPGSLLPEGICPINIFVG